MVGLSRREAKRQHRSFATRPCHDTRIAQRLIVQRTLWPFRPPIANERARVGRDVPPSFDGSDEVVCALCIQPTSRSMYICLHSYLDPPARWASSSNRASRSKIFPACRPFWSSSALSGRTVRIWVKLYLLQQVFSGGQQCHHPRPNVTRAITRLIWSSALASPAVQRRCTEQQHPPAGYLVIRCNAVAPTANWNDLTGTYSSQ